MSSAKTAEPIEIPFGMWTQLGPRKHVGPMKHVCIDGLQIGATWRIPLIEQSMCGGDAAFCQITLTMALVCFSHSFYVSPVF